MQVPQTLSGKSILVVEDDFFDELEIAVEASGHLTGMNGVHDQVIALLKGGDIGAAILDGHLDHEKQRPVAEALRELGIPFVVSGMGTTQAGGPMQPGLGELTLLAHQLFGAPTFH